MQSVFSYQYGNLTFVIPYRRLEVLFGAANQDYIVSVDWCNYFSSVTKVCTDLIIFQLRNVNNTSYSIHILYIHLSAI